MLNFICYPKCTTCQKAKKWLDDNKIQYELRDIKLNNPTYEELTEWYNKSGLPLKKFFNTSGLLYKSLELKTKLPTMTEDEMKQYVADHMARHKVPRYIDFVDAFPMNAAGKILKYKMRDESAEKLGLKK